MEQYLGNLERQVWREIQAVSKPNDRAFWEEYYLSKYAIKTKVDKFWGGRL